MIPVCCEPTLCLLATRISVKLMVMIFVIVGVAAAQMTADIGSNGSMTYTLKTLTLEAGGVTTSMTLSEFFTLVGGGDCGDNMMAMFDAALAMGIICILCSAAGIGMAVVNKFLGNKIPALIFVCVAGMEWLTALIGFAVIASALNGGACDSMKMSDIEGSKYGAGFIMFIIGWIISFGDIAVEALVFLGMLGAPSTPANLDSPMTDTIVHNNNNNGLYNNNSGFSNNNNSDFAGL